MAKIRAEMVTYVADALGKSSNAVARSGATMNDRIIDALNFAQQRIARAYSFDELNEVEETFTLTASTKRYSIVDDMGLTNFKDINSIRLIDGENSIKLDRWNYRKFDKFYPRPENFSTGRPRVYVRWGRNVTFFKIPNDDYALYTRYSKWPTALTAGTQESDYLDKDPLIVATGILEMYLLLEEYEDAKIWFQRVSGLLQDAIKAESDVDWEPQAMGSGEFAYPVSGTPWTDPFGSAGDPLYGMDW